MAPASGGGGEDGIAAVVSAGLEEHDFFRRIEDWALARRKRSALDKADLLVDGRWACGRPSGDELDSDGWEQLDEERLRLHVRRYLTADLTAAAIEWHSRPWRHLTLSPFYRWFLPPLRGGAGRRIDADAIGRSRRAYAALLAEVPEDSLGELKEQALLGYEHQRERAASAEQRSNFFLGAAGLTTSLVLANAGFLLGADRLDSPWRELAAVDLGLASACAMMAGIRAMQASMVTFVRTPPNALARLVERRKMPADEMLRSYVASVLVAAGRAKTVGDWKVRRFADARRWFGGVIVGVILLTGMVLVEAL